MLLTVRRHHDGWVGGAYGSLTLMVSKPTTPAVSAYQQGGRTVGLYPLPASKRALSAYRSVMLILSGSASSYISSLILITKMRKELSGI